MRKKHSFESCFASAAKYSTRLDWRTGDGDAYYAAYKNKWANKCCSHMKTGKKHIPEKNNKYSVEKCKKSAAKYSLRTEWREKAPKFYEAAKRNNCLEECCSHMALRKRKHTLASCLLSASKHFMRYEWRRSDKGSYQAARINGWMDQCIGHMHDSSTGKYTLDDCKASSAKYIKREVWKEEEPKFYWAAKKNSWLVECCWHMSRRPRTSNCVYIWKATGVYFNDEPVFKIGVTNSSIGDSRIRQVAKSSCFTPEIVVLKNLGISAKPLEAKLLAIGQSPQYTGFDGCTEFRALNPSAFDAVMTLIAAALEAPRIKKANFPLRNNGLR